MVFTFFFVSRIKKCIVLQMLINLLLLQLDIQYYKKWSIHFYFLLIKEIDKIFLIYFLYFNKINNFWLCFLSNKVRCVITLVFL